MPHSALASPSATIAALDRFGLHTKKHLGQHFLVDDNVVGRILQLADVDESDAVLEIGPGIGTLTVALCPRVGALVAVEQDADLLPALESLASECRRLRVVLADAVDVPVSELSTELGPPTALVANLPYGVAATVVLRIFSELPSVRSATVMVQAEVARRMAAEPGGKDYGAYTVKLALLAKPSVRFGVSRTCFLPPPRVDSTVLRLERREDGLGRDDSRLAAAAADAAFAQRRKTVRNSLASALGGSTEAVEEALLSCRIEPGLRAETLTPDDFVRLGIALKDACLLS